MFKGRFPYLKRMGADEEKKLKQKIFDIVFEADTPYGKLFDISLLLLILLSVGLVMLESIPAINARHHTVLVSLEWILTFLFTIEYLLRIYCVKNRWRYIFSFYGVIDLLSILPFYLGLVLPTSKYLASIRILRLLRIFRIFNLTRFTRGKNVLVLGLKESKDKIIVFLSFVVLIVVVIGSIMYMVEHDHPESGFTSIPISIYWAIVTLTTVGYGDISPVTGLGQFLASVVMIIGYGVIAVPTSIVTMEMNKAARHKEDIPTNTQRCRNCGDDYHLDGAIYCKTCGHLLNEP
ncbi:ion transporter [Empedobacter falsenii]|uniref:Ion transporter n=1 Tax=Empedobacter falsenii TaxID=343874 RepID=A0A7H9DUG8_9FLAO|nr:MULTISPECIES: ion transporter [Empedobacter]HCC92715.1 ion transporter [Flavobacteriaceae bacterium]MDH1883176.1 ion transporter [Empedobacter sp. GD03797]MDM1063746.1 ion transporter [Empedobacter falsenii]MDM1546742.1 ion transporter [Empedobacter falsenii]MDM1549827.1 ion transporter [Empedobacter falsenii]